MLGHRKRPATPPGGLGGAPRSFKSGDTPWPRGARSAAQWVAFPASSMRQGRLTMRPASPAYAPSCRGSGKRDRRCTFCLIQCTRPMFTGIITDVGRVRALRRPGDTRIEIETEEDTGSLSLGASVACAGCCLTVVEKGHGWFAVDASAETAARTTLGDWRQGTPINLERALRAGDELGGHLVFGHVDTTTTVLNRAEEGDSLRLSFALPADIATLVATKGSITIDGVSLTVNEVTKAAFGINLIPHTRAVTTLGDLRPGDRVNVEIDMLARYVARLLSGARP